VAHREELNVAVRGGIAAATAVLLAPALVGCGVNFNAQTDQPYNPGAGTSNQTSSVDVINALIVSGSDGSGTLVAGLVNKNPSRADQLVSVAGARTDKALQAHMAGPLTVGSEKLLNLATKGQVTVFGSQVKPGAFVTLTWTFKHAQTVTFDVPVLSASNPDYAKVPLPSGH
jgi:hypothetical protein